MDLGQRLGDHPLDTLRHAVTAATIDGIAAEFGVASGTTTAIIATRFHVYGFDSFQGLPETWRPGFPAGMFAGQHPRDLTNITLVEGWFTDTLPSWTPPAPLALVHIDCDLYTSTITVLDHVGHHMQPGTVVVFDEYHGYPGHEQHEARAWAEFTDRSGVTWEPLGHGPEQLAIRLT